MKKAILIIAITLGIQTINAHPGADHVHESILHEWSWILIPAVVVVGLVYKLSKKNYSSNKR